MVNSNISLLVFFAIGLVIPFLVDLVTKKLAAASVKASVLLALSLISGVLTQFLNATLAGGTFDWVTAGYGAAVAFITGTATFFGFTKPVGLSNATSNVLPSVGLGKEQPLVPAPAVVANPAVDDAPVVPPAV